MKRPDNWAYVFILPFFLVFAIFTAYPIINTMWVSLTNETMTSFEEPIFIGLENYVSELSQPLFWQALLNTWIIWLPNIVAQISLGIGLAWILTNQRLRIRGQAGFRAIYFFPNLVTVASIAVLAYALFDWQKGPVNFLLFGTGPEAAKQYIWWFNDATMSRVIVAVIQTWMWFGYTMIMFIAGFNSISASYIEAAVIDGANEWQVFSRVSMPLLRPMMTYVIITSLIGGMQMFDLPWVLTNGAGNAPGGVENSLTTSMVYLYSRAFSWDQNLASASAVSWLLFMFIAVVSAIYLRVTRDKEGVNE